MTWYLYADFISDSSKIPISKDLCDYYKDWDYTLIDDNIPADNEYSKDTEKNNAKYNPD